MTPFTPSILLLFGESALERIAAQVKPGRTASAFICSLKKLVAHEQATRFGTCLRRMRTYVLFKPSLKRTIVRLTTSSWLQKIPCISGKQLSNGTNILSFVSITRQSSLAVVALPTGTLYNNHIIYMMVLWRYFPNNKLLSSRAESWSGHFLVFAI